MSIVDETAFQQCKHCFVRTREDLEFDEFLQRIHTHLLRYFIRDSVLSCPAAVLSFASLLTDDSYAFHRSVLRDDDSP